MEKLTLKQYKQQRLSGIQCLQLMAQLPSDDSGESGDSENISDDELNRPDVKQKTAVPVRATLKSGPDEEESVAEENLSQSLKSSSKQGAEAGSKKRK